MNNLASLRMKNQSYLKVQKVNIILSTSIFQLSTFI